MEKVLSKKFEAQREKEKCKHVIFIILCVCVFDTVSCSHFSHCEVIADRAGRHASLAAGAVHLYETCQCVCAGWFYCTVK